MLFFILQAINRGTVFQSNEGVGLDRDIFQLIGNR